MVASLFLWMTHRHGGRPGALARSLAFLVLALLSKSMALVTPVLMLAWEAAVRRAAGAPFTRRDAVTLVAALAGPILVVLIFTAQFAAIGRASGVIRTWHGGDPASHAFLMGWAFVLYLAKSVAPTSFRLMYCFELPSGAADPRVWAAALVGPAYLAALVWAWRRDRRAFFLLAWFAICLLPVMNIVPFPAIFADRYAYAASFGSCCALALLCERLRPSLGRALLGGMVAVMGLVVAVRNGAWLQESILWREVVEDRACRGIALPLIKLGDAFMREGRWAEALFWYDRGTAHPGFGGPAVEVSTVHLNASRAAARLRLHDAARRHAQAALRVDPRNDEAWAELWKAEWWAGDLRGALATAERAMAWHPATPLHRWGRALLRLELDADARAAAEVAALVAREPALCASLASWRQAHPPGTAARAAVDAAGAGVSCPPP
jgi:hypothetical protein